MRRHTHVSLFLVAISLSASSAFGQSRATTLRRHFNEDGRFEAMMPANTKSVHIPGKTITDSHYIARGKSGDSEFRLKVQVISPIDVSSDLKLEMAAAYADSAREQLEKSFGRAEANEAVVQHKMPGRNLIHRISSDKSPNGKELLFNQRVMFDGKRLYIATHISTPTKATDALRKVFLDSVQPLNAKSNSPGGGDLTRKMQSKANAESSPNPTTPAGILAQRISRTRGSATYLSTHKGKQIVAPLHFSGGGDVFTMLLQDESNPKVSEGFIIVTDGLLKLTYSDENFQAFLDDREVESFFFKPAAGSENGVLVLKPVLKDGSPRRINTKASRYNEAIREIRISEGGDPRLSPAQRLEAFAAAPRSKISFDTPGPGVRHGDVILVDDTTVVVTLPDGEGTTEVEKGTYRLSGDRLQFTFDSATSEFAISTTKDDGTLELKPVAAKVTGDSLIGLAATLLVSEK